MGPPIFSDQIVDEFSFEYMGYDVTLQVRVGENYRDEDVRQVSAKAKKPSTEFGDYIREKHQTKIDGETKLLGLIRVKPTPLEEQIEIVSQNVKEKIKNRTEQQLQTRKKIKEVKGQ